MALATIPVAGITTQGITEQATTVLAITPVMRQPVLSRSQWVIAPTIHAAPVTGWDRIITGGDTVTGIVTTVAASGSMVVTW